TLPLPARTGLPALSRLLTLPDRVTAVCEFLAHPIRQVRGSAPTDIIPCIVEPGAVTPRRDRSDGALRMVSTGGLIPRKDPLIAVEVLAQLVERGVDAHLEWLGEGPLRQDTSALAAQLQVSDRLSLPGSVDGAGVREALGRADLFFGPTRADNFFVSAAEATVAAAYARAQQLTRTTGAPFPVRPAAAGSEDVTVAGDIEGADDVQGAAGDVEGAAGDTPPSLLVLSFSDISRDARVLKQVTMFSTDYRVMTCGYGPTPEGSTWHLQIPEELKQWRLDKRLALTGRYRRTYWEQEVVAWVVAQGLPRTDVVLANDVDTVPLALSIQPRGGVHADLHEYAPMQKEDRPAWLLLVAYNRRCDCPTHVARADCVKTGGHGVASEYEREFGVHAEVVTNAAPFQELSPTPVPAPLRLVH